MGSQIIKQQLLTFHSQLSMDQIHQITQQAQFLLNNLQENTCNSLNTLCGKYNQLFTDKITDSVNNQFYSDINNETTFIFVQPPFDYNPQKMCMQQLDLQNILTFQKPSALKTKFNHSQKVNNKLKAIKQKQQQFYQVEQNNEIQQEDSDKDSNLINSFPKARQQMQNIKNITNQQKWNKIQQQSHQVEDKMDILDQVDINQVIEYVYSANIQKIVQLQQFTRMKLQRKKYLNMIQRIRYIQQYIKFYNQRTKFINIFKEVQVKNYEMMQNKYFYNKLLIFNQNQLDFKSYLNTYYQINNTQQNIKTQYQQLINSQLFQLIFPIQFSKTAFFDREFAEGQIIEYLKEKNLTDNQINQNIIQLINQQVNTSINENQYKINILLLCNNIGISELSHILNDYVDQLIIVSEKQQLKLDYYYKILNITHDQQMRIKIVQVSKNLKQISLDQNQSGDIIQKLYMNKNALLEVKKYYQTYCNNQFYLITQNLAQNNFNNKAIFDKNLFKLIDDINSMKNKNNVAQSNNLFSLVYSQQQEQDFNSLVIQQNPYFIVQQPGQFNNYIADQQVVHFLTNSLIDYQQMARGATNSYKVCQINSQSRQQSKSQSQVVSGKKREGGLNTNNSQLHFENSVSDIKINEYLLQEENVNQLQFESLMPVKTCDQYGQYMNQFAQEYINSKSNYKCYIFNKLAFEYNVLKRVLKYKEVIQGSRENSKQSTYSLIKNPDMQVRRGYKTGYNSILAKSIKFDHIAENVEDEQKIDKPEVNLQQNCQNNSNNQSQQLQNNQVEQLIQEKHKAYTASISFLIIEKQLTYLTSCEDIIEYTPDNIPYRCHGHIFPARETDIAVMRDNMVVIVNGLIKQQYGGIFTVQFLIGQVVEPFYITFGITKQIQLSLTVYKLKCLNNSQNAQRFMMVNFYHSYIYKAKQQIAIQLLKNHAFDNDVKQGWYFEFADTDFWSVCFSGEKSIQQQKLEIKSILKIIQSEIHKMDPECATSIFSKSADQKRDKEQLSAIGSLMGIL